MALLSGLSLFPGGWEIIAVVESHLNPLSCRFLPRGYCRGWCMCYRLFEVSLNIPCSRGSQAHIPLGWTPCLARTSAQPLCWWRNSVTSSTVWSCWSPPWTTWRTSSSSMCSSFTWRHSTEARLRMGLPSPHGKVWEAASPRTRTGSPSRRRATNGSSGSAPSSQKASHRSQSVDQVALIPHYPWGCVKRVPGPRSIGASGQRSWSDFALVPYSWAHAFLWPHLLSEGPHSVKAPELPGRRRPRHVFRTVFGTVWNIAHAIAFFDKHISHCHECNVCRGLAAGGRKPLVEQPWLLM